MPAPLTEKENPFATADVLEALDAAAERFVPTVVLARGHFLPKNAFRTVAESLGFDFTHVDIGEIDRSLGLNAEGPGIHNPL